MTLMGGDMKLILLISLILSSTTFAYVYVSGKVRQVVSINDDCEYCLPSTQTITTFNIISFSCMKYDKAVFKITVKDMGIFRNNYKVVKVIRDNPLIDCRGPLRPYNYSVSTKELDKSDSYIIENPTIVEKPGARIDPLRPDPR